MLIALPVTGALPRVNHHAQSFQDVTRSTF
jgi:hypothetical protein